MGPPATSAPGRATAQSLLQKFEPGVTWKTGTLLEADFDGDSVKDYALGGIKEGDRYVVGIVRGPLGDSARHWTLEFGADEGDQESLCSLQAAMSLENLDESVIEESGGKLQGSKGINLHDDRCDAFHIHWSPKDQRFEWWRL
ncbi:MAG TPA: hypothetical protein VMW27_24005 [Thermoanaerobaculia bacterium]|nr:hypothetical protein [Thermoanaerobaculia bacterium]